MIRINLLPFRAARKKENIKRQITVYGLVIVLLITVMAYYFLQLNSTLTNLKDKEREDLEEIFTSVVSGWVNEIKRALDFLATTYPDETIEKIFVSGGSCRIPGFFKLLELETDSQVEELNPFANLQINEKIFDPRYLSYMAPQACVAVGLALRSIGDK